MLWPKTGEGTPPTRASRSAFSSSLDPLETIQQPGQDLELKLDYWRRPEFSCAPATRGETAFRHSGWRVRRKIFWDALVRTNASQGRLEHFQTCGASLWVQKAVATDQVRIVGNCCHDRFCLPCQSARAARIRANLAAHLKDHPARFVTLTLRHSRTPLNDQIDRIYRSFTELKRREFWKQNVIGGVAFLEVKLGERDGLWHVHLHCLVEGSYLDQRGLSEAWHAVTGDSSIVDVRRISSDDAAAHYVTKYVTKPADSSVLANHDALDEFVIAMKGRRLFNPFGTLRKIKLDEVPDDGTEWSNVTSLANLIADAQAGDVGATALLIRLEEKYPQLTTLWMHDRPPP